MTALRFFLVITLCISSYSYGQNSAALLNDAQAILKHGKTSKAIKAFETTLTKAKQENNVQIQMDCHLNLADLKNNVIKYKEALSHYEAFSKLYKIQAANKTKALEESVIGLEAEVEEGIVAIEEGEIAIEEKNKAIDSLTTEQLKSQLSIVNLELDNQKHQLEIEESENRRNILISVLAMFGLLILFVGIGYFQKRKANRTLASRNMQIIHEKEKSEKLLLNILPKTVAEELKEYGKTTSARFDMATVMFTDFEGFTKFAEKNSPEDLVSLIDYYFCEFDQIMMKYDIEKIKTIGDSYLCVSGIPEQNNNHVSNMINAAFEIQQFVNQTIVDQKKVGGNYLDMRIGIHAGPLVAGVVGDRKFAYDVWGDTVNIAARMEQSGEINGINVSETVYKLVKEDYRFDYRGEVEAKNKGKMKMYFVKELEAVEVL